MSIEDRESLEGGTPNAEREIARDSALRISNSPLSASGRDPKTSMGLVRFNAGGLRWRVTPECRDRLFGPEGLRLQEWLAAGQAVLVKRGPHRQVYRVNLPGLSFYLKHNRVRDVRTWVRQLVRPSKAAMEFRGAVAVAARGVPTVTPLGLAERGGGWGPRDSFLLIRTLEDTEPLSTFIEHTLTALERDRRFRVSLRLAKELGHFIAQVHDAGILHDDLHAGNILVRLASDDRPRLFLIDLHAVKIGTRLSWKASQANLVVLSHWFMIHASRTDRLRFWLAYFQARQRSKIEDRESRIEGEARFDDREATMEEGDQICVDPQSSILDLRSSSDPRSSLPLARDLEERSWKSTLRLWKTRERRYLSWNRSFKPARSSTVRGHVVRDLDRAVVAELLADPDAPFRRPELKVLKDSCSSIVAEFALSLGGVTRPVVYKRFQVKAWTEPLAAWVRRSPALRSWIFGHGLSERGLPTPRPLAVLHRRRHGLSFEGYLLTEKIDDALELHDFVTSLDSLPSHERGILLRRSIEQVGRLVRDLHLRQLSHRDLKAANILVVSHESSSLATIHRSPSVWLVDLVGVRRHRRLSRRRRVRNLARLHASFYHSPSLTRTDKLRFLRMYLQWGLFGRDGWKRWWREIEVATRAKIARNARLRRPLG
jgi:tRNA A-37 threonylcarbamoyl transferase component Bud32